MTDDKIVAHVTGQNDSATDSDDYIEESQPELSTVSHAVDSLENISKWLECRADSDPYHILVDRKWRDEAAQKRAQSLKHTPLLS